MQRGVERGKAMAALRRYGIHGCAQQPFETLSGGQQARLQILLLELAGSTLLLLDEPTDNLDLASAEALEDALEQLRRHRRRRHATTAGSCAASTASSCSAATPPSPSTSSPSSPEAAVA